MKMKKTAVCIVSAIMIVSLLAGCGKTTGQEAQPAQDTKAPDSSQTKTEAPAAEGNTEESVTLTFFTGLNEKSASLVTSYADILAIQIAGEKTNVNIEWMHPPIGQEKEQFNLMVASQSLPDIIYWNWILDYPGGPEKAISDKIILPLNDYMGEAVNLSNSAKRYPVWDKQMKTDEENYYMFPEVYEGNLEKETQIHNYWVGPQYRKDWADKLGIAEPVTLDDWYNMLVAFKTQDPAGDGTPVIPWSAMSDPTANQSLYRLSSAFGFLMDFYMEGDKIEHGLLSSNLKDYVATMRKWYQEDLIDKDFLVNDSTAFKAKIANGTVGAYIGTMGGNYVSLNKLLQESFPDARITYAHWPESVDGTRYTSQVGVSDAISGNGAALTPNCSNIEAAIRYLDYGYSDEGKLLHNFGVEGVTFEMKNGEMKWIDSIQKEMDEKGLDNVLPQYAFGGCYGWATPTMTENNKYTRIYPGQYESAFTWGDSSPALTVPPISPKMDESARIADIMNEVNTYRDEVIGKIIMGKLGIDEVDTLVENVKKMGIEEAVAIQNKALERYNLR